MIKSLQGLSYKVYSTFFRKKNIFKKHLLINVQQSILPRTMEWLRDATDALEQED